MKNSGKRLQSALSLRSLPVGIALVDSVPPEVAHRDGQVPAGCSFWELAEGGVFSTKGADHELCSVGVYTHNLAGVSERHASELASVLKVMNDLDYLSDEDLARVPHVKKESAHASIAQVPARERGALSQFVDAAGENDLAPGGARSGRGRSAWRSWDGSTRRCSNSLAS